MLKPDSTISRAQLYRRRRAGISVPGIYTTNENLLQSETLNKLDKPKPIVSFVEGFEPEPPSLGKILAEKANMRNIARKKRNDN